MVWGSFLIAAAAFKTPTRNGYNAQGVNLTLYTQTHTHTHIYTHTHIQIVTDLGIGLHTILSRLTLYCVWLTEGRSEGGRILRNGRALVLQ